MMLSFDITDLKRYALRRSSKIAEHPHSYTPAGIHITVPTI